MYILSIDVGIKNLAYCLFHLKNETDYAIAKWNVLDLVSDQKMICGVSKKNGDKCKYQAKYCKNNEYFCKKHAKASDTYLIANTELNKVKYKRMACHKLKALVEKQGINLDSDKKYTKTELVDILDKFIEERCFNVISEKKCDTINLVMLGRKLCEKFNKDLEILSVFIEKRSFAGVALPKSNRIIFVEPEELNFKLYACIQFEFFSAFSIA